MSPRYRAFVGPQHAFYSLAAAIIGAAIILIDLTGALTVEQRTQGFAVFPMMYFAGTVAGFAYGPHEFRNPNRLANIYWRFGKVPYFAAALVGVAHIVLFNDWSAFVAYASGLLAVFCLLPSLFVRLGARGNAQ
jgi:hypothetical protein